MKVTKSKLILFSVAIAFISVFFFAYAVQAVYPAPEYEDFCDRENSENINNSIDCETNGGKWMSAPSREMPVEIKGWCDINFECNKEYDTVRDTYERNVFFANLIIGIIVFVVAFFLGLEAVSSGLMSGAVMLIVYGSIRYWGKLSDVWRTLMLGTVLAILIWLGYKKLKN
ncbi:hypothetical protein K8R30_04555 [archaeon]|nr:hypothetical protein [archaeon]